MSSEMEWWLCEPEGDRELIGLIRNLTLDEQNEMTERLKDLSAQTPVFGYKKSPGHDLPLTIP